MERDANVAHSALLNEKLLLQLQRQTACTPMNLLDKAPIYHQGEELLFVFILRQGAVKLSRVNRKGDQFTNAILTAGEIFGPGLWESANSEAQETAICKGATQLVRVPKQNFKDFLARHPAWAWHLIQGLLGRQLQAERRLEAVLYQDVQTRLVRLLCERVLFSDVSEQRDQVFEVRLKQQELADLIGASRPVVSTILKEFKRHGILSSSRESILIEKIAALKKMASE